MHSMCIIFGKNLESRKSAIAMSFFVETSDRGDFRDLGIELGGMHDILGLGASDSCGRRKSRCKKRITFFSLHGGWNVLVHMRENAEEMILRRLI